VVSHDERRRFDAEDLRVMTHLGTFAAAAYQNLLSLNAAQRIAAIVESSSDAIVSKTLEGIITTWNEGATRLFGYTADEIIGKPVTILIPADRQDEGRVIIDRIEHGERVEQYETIRRRKDGSLVPISLTISPVRNAAGEIVGASKIAQDISERKRKEERIDLLAHEVDHRSKNLLALVQAVVQLTQGETPGALKTAIEGRIRALANAHRLLAQSRWAGADLHSLLTEELAPYCPEGQSRTEICGPALTLKPKSAQSISIILHELTTNAVKYGALSTPAGRVGVEWSCATDGRLVISWTETGGPPMKPPSHRGVGTRVIEQIICGELDGKARFDWRADGLACELALDPHVQS
jgi:PAS domain S-box-containing protein